MTSLTRGDIKKVLQSKRGTTAYFVADRQYGIEVPGNVVKIAGVRNKKVVTVEKELTRHRLAPMKEI